MTKNDGRLHRALEALGYTGKEKRYQRYNLIEQIVIFASSKGDETLLKQSEALLDSIRFENT